MKRKIISSFSKTFKNVSIVKELQIFFKFSKKKQKKKCWQGIKIIFSKDFPRQTSRAETRKFSKKREKEDKKNLLKLRMKKRRTKQHNFSTISEQIFGSIFSVS